MYLFEFWNVASLLLVYSQVLMYCTQPLSPTKLPTCDEEEEEEKKEEKEEEKKKEKNKNRKQGLLPKKFYQSFPVKVVVAPLCSYYNASHYL